MFSKRIAFNDDKRDNSPFFELLSLIPRKRSCQLRAVSVLINLTPLTDYFDGCAAIHDVTHRHTATEYGLHYEVFHAPKLRSRFRNQSPYSVKSGYQDK